MNDLRHSAWRQPTRRADGPLLPMEPAKASLFDLWSARFGYALALLTLAYFAAQVVRGLS